MFFRHLFIFKRILRALGIIRTKKSEQSIGKRDKIKEKQNPVVTE